MEKCPRRVSAVLPCRKVPNEATDSNANAPAIDWTGRHRLDESRYNQGKCKLAEKECIRAFERPASPGPHCARAHDHAIRDLRPSTQALPSRQNPISTLLEGAHAPAQHTAPIGRRRSRHPPYPTPRSRRSRRRWPRRGHSRQARHASVRSMKTTYRGATFHLIAFSNLNTSTRQIHMDPAQLI